MSRGISSAFCHVVRGQRGGPKRERWNTTLSDEKENRWVQTCSFLGKKIHIQNKGIQVEKKQSSII